MLAGLPPEIKPDTSSLQFAICGAAPMPPMLIETFEDRYGVSIIEGEPVRVPKVSVMVAAQLRRSIIRGDFKPGDPLPNESAQGSSQIDTRVRTVSSSVQAAYAPAAKRTVPMTR